MNATQRREVLGLALLALGLFLALSLVPLPRASADGALSGNLMGVLGGAVAYAGHWAIGFAIYLLPLIPIVLGAARFGWLENERGYRFAALITGLCALLPAALAMLSAGQGIEGAQALPGTAGGWLGETLSLPLVALLGWFGGFLLLLFFLLVLIALTVGLDAVRSLFELFRRRREEAPEPVAEAPLDWSPAPVIAPSREPEPVVEEAPAEKPRKPRLKLTREREPVLEDTGNPGSTERPPLTLLTPQPPHDVAVSEKELDRLGQVLIDTLKTFKVEGQIGGRTTGPVVTQFEVVPAPGVKVNRIASLDADLALALRAPSVRIVAPIPGKGAVGVEVPNPEPDIVYLREILESGAFQKAKGTLPIALGKDLTGKSYVADLARMPHLLIAGATGSGKSVCVNTIITSLVYRYAPSELRLLLVDPKMVELSMYSDLPHLRHPVVTDPKDAATVLKWAVLEMERRYTLLSENGARSLSEFNRRVHDGAILRRPEPKGEETDPDQYIYRDGPLPYIVVVLDELADLMLAVQAEVERPLAQLAQKARAIGIHLIVATQRPSVNVITGLIKANFPCRIAFRVSSKVDSRTILDQNGADALLGNGDMLFLPPGRSDPERIQGAYIATEDTDHLMAWYRDRALQRPEVEEDILDVVRAREAEEASDYLGDGMMEERDALFRQAAEICIQFQQGSTSLLQRRLRIGYGRAARIIDQLHHAGVLGPPDGSKPREVLVGLDALHGIPE